MDLNEYQKLARETAIYGRREYPYLGLCGEAGEVAEVYKKVLRDDNGIIGQKGRAKLVKELGDVLWYVANISEDLGFSLNHIAEENVRKLDSRAKRGVLKGDGNER
jgi:NTP pyrophosphatase (non-canonical NTP hydrolase)